MKDQHVSLIIGQKLLELGYKFWFIHHFHQTLHLGISIYLDFYKVLLMEKKKNSIFWKTVKDTWNSSLLKRDKRFCKDGIIKLSENGRR